MWRKSRPIEKLRARVATREEENARRDLEDHFTAVVAPKKRKEHISMLERVERDMDLEERGFPEVMNQFPVLEVPRREETPRKEGSGGVKPSRGAGETTQVGVESEPSPEGTDIAEVLQARTPKEMLPQEKLGDPHAVTPIAAFGRQEAPESTDLREAISKLGNALGCKVDPPTWRATEIADRGKWKRFLQEYLRYLAANGTCHPRTQVDADLMQALQWILPPKDWAAMSAFEWLREMDAFLTTKNSWAMGLETLTLEITAGSTPNWQKFVKDIEALIQVSTAHISEKKKAIWRAVEKAKLTAEAQQIENRTRDPQVDILATTRVVAEVLSTTATYTRAALLRSQGESAGSKRTREGDDEPKQTNGSTFALPMKANSAIPKHDGCYLCRQRGHFAYNCPNKAYVSSHTRDTRRRTTTEGRSKGKKEEKENKQTGPARSVINAFGGEGANCWIHFIEANRTVDALLDSGSPHYSFILEKTARVLRLVAKPLATPVRVAVGNGDIIEIQKYVEARIRFPTGRKADAQFLVLPGCPFEVVVGHDLLPSMEAMARQVRVGKRGRFTKQLDSAVYCALEADSWIEEEEGVPEGAEELIEIPITVAKAGEYLTLPGVEPGSRVYRVCLKHSKVFGNSIRVEPAKIKAMIIRLFEKLARWPSEMRQRIRQIPEAYKEEVSRMLNEMLENGVIERVTESEFYSQLLIIRKKDGSLRLCVDFRALNALTVRNRYPLPLIRELVAKLKGKRVLGVLDLSSGYWQAPLEPGSRKYTVFATTEGLFQFKRVAFGLCNAPAFFQHAIQTEVLGDLTEAAIVYIDDILVFGKDEEEFLENLDKVLGKLAEHGIIVKPSKCRLGVSSVEYLGMRITAETVEMTPDRKRAILDIAKPTTVTEMRSFLGVVNYFRSHIPRYADLTAELYQMIENEEGAEGRKGKLTALQWTPEREGKFEAVKNAAANAETLFHFEEGQEIIVKTDASDYAIGGVVLQKTQEGERPLLFISKKLSRSQRNYSTSDKEMLSIFHCIRAAHQILAGRRFTVFSDHKPLSSARVSASPRIERMKLALQEYQFTIQYLRGEDNETADLMSRLVTMQITEQIEEVKEEDRISVIAMHHNGFTGHLGRDATVEEIRRSGRTWPGIRDDVARFIGECLVCQVGRPARGLRHGQMHLEARGPGQEWGADALELESVGGFKFVLVVVCHFTRFVHLAPLRSMGAEDCEKVLEKLFLTFGRPDRLRTDNAKNFKAELVKDLLVRYAIASVDIPPNDSRSNAMVERAIQEVRRHLFAVREDSKVAWPQAISRVQFIMNRRIHTATGYAPADLLFGRIGSLGYGEMERSIRRADGDGQDWHGETGREEEETQEKAAGEVGDDNIDMALQEIEIEDRLTESERERARVVHNQADVQEAAVVEQQVRAARRQTETRPEARLAPGDRVWVKTRSNKRNSRREHWLGPETVKSRNGDLVVITGPERDQTVAISKLRRVTGQRRYDTTNIESILDHNPYQAGLEITRYQLKIKRIGDDHVHWLPAAELANHIQFQRYALEFEDLRHLADAADM